MNYRRFNIILLLALLALGPALLLVPWLREHTGALYPGCALEQLAGRRCPMCGLTTGLRNLLVPGRHGGDENPLTIPAAAVVLLEIAVRAVLSVRRLSPNALQLAKRRDIQLHAALVIAYLVYCVAFFASHS